MAAPGSMMPPPALARLSVDELTKLGLDVPVNAAGVPRNRYRWKRLFDTQAIPAAAGTKISLFATSTSSRGTHARGLSGCNLQTGGQLDLNSDFLLLGLSLEYILGIDADDDAQDDIVKLNEYGLLEELRVNEQKVLDEILFSAMPCNRGVSFDVTNAGKGTTFALDGAVNGRPGQAEGLILPAASRIYITHGEKIEAVCVHNAAAALTAARTVRLSMLGIEIEGRSSAD